MWYILVRRFINSFLQDLSRLCDGVVRQGWITNIAILGWLKVASLSSLVVCRDWILTSLVEVISQAILLMLESRGRHCAVHCL